MALEDLLKEVEQVFIGKEDVVQKSLVCLLAGGHLLIEDVPGMGKTTLAICLAKATGCSFQRIQLTSDLLPSDILGVSILNPKTHDFEFRKGPLFNQIILADELNRATPRTQSALLEAMNERQVTLDNQTFPLPAPFFVIGTQNPHEHHGTFPLPESQLDRFMMRLSVGYPSLESEKKILSMAIDHDQLRDLKACATPENVLQWQKTTRTIHVSSVVDDYILKLVRATRENERIEVGVSPRGALALRKAIQAYAMLKKRDFVLPDDVKQLAVAVLAHRLVLRAQELGDAREKAESLIRSLLQTLPVPL